MDEYYYCINCDEYHLEEEVAKDGFLWCPTTETEIKYWKNPESQMNALARKLDLT